MGAGGKTKNNIGNIWAESNEVILLHPNAGKNSWKKNQHTFWVSCTLYWSYFSLSKAVIDASVANKILKKLFQHDTKYSQYAV